MPNYTYQCEQCGHQFSRHQKMTDSHLECCCPECGGPVKRMIGAGTGLLFKGDGFYITDYKNKEKSPPAKKSDQ